MHYSTHHHHRHHRHRRRVVQYSSSAAKTSQERRGGKGRPRCVDLTLTRVAPKIKQHGAWIVKRRGGGMGWRDGEGFETEFVRDKNSLRQVRAALRKRDRSIKLIVPVCFGGWSREKMIIFGLNRIDFIIV